MEKKIRKSEPINIGHLLLMIIIPFICVGGATPVPYKLKVPLIYFTGIVFLLVFIFSDKKIKLNTVNVSAFLLLCFLAIQLLYSYDIQSTFKLLIIYACSFTVLFIDIPLNSIDKIISVMLIFCVVIASSIIISVPIENCMLTYFRFIVNPNNTPSVQQAILKELSIGSYSGFAREKGEAAFIMNIGLAIIFSRFFSKGKLTLKETVTFMLLISALILTGKRTMFTIPIICFIVLMVVSKIKGRFFKFCCVVLTTLFALFFILMFMPDFANLFYRFMDIENLESIGSRDTLWKYMAMMVSKYWLLGAGFGSYNEFAYDNGLRVYEKKWLYNGHNSYYQALAELGIIGFVIFLVFLLSALFKSLKYIRKYNFNSSQTKIFFFALYIQIMFIVYSVTGNPFYTNQMVFSLFFSTGAMLCVGRNSENSSTTKNKKKGGNL